MARSIPLCESDKLYPSSDLMMNVRTRTYALLNEWNEKIKETSSSAYRNVQFQRSNSNIYSNITVFPQTVLNDAQRMMDEVISIENHLSLKTLRFFMRFVGMWPTTNSRDRFISDVVLFYTSTTIISGFIIMIVDFYHVWGDINAMANNIPITITVIIEIAELIKFVTNRTEVINFNTYTEKIFWKVPYDSTEAYILDQCNRKSIRMVVCDFLLAQGILWAYLIIPIIESIGENATQRMLPFNLYIDLPLAETPYYELACIIECAVGMGVTVCATIFAGYLGTINFYTAGQFRILQRRLERAIYNIKNTKVENSIDKVKADMNSSNIKDCIAQHQVLIRYIDRLESLFNMIMLVQTLGSILMMCFVSLQILLDSQRSTLRMATSVEYLFVSMVQLFLFAWPCHEIITESQEVSEAAYRALWFQLPSTSQGRTCRQLLLIVITRARRPCTLTVGKFAPMSLQTFTFVFNKALSFVTVLRRMNEPEQ